MSDTAKVLANKSTLYREHVNSQCCTGEEESGDAWRRAKPVQTFPQPPDPDLLHWQLLVGLFSYLGDSDLINMPVVINVCRAGNWI